MKFEELKYPEWNGKYQVVGYFGDLMLLLIDCIVYKDSADSLSNLVATNSEFEIVWIANIPEKGIPYKGKYYCVSVDGDTIKAWFESTIIYLDIKTGNIISEHFVK